MVSNIRLLKTFLQVFVLISISTPVQAYSELETSVSRIQLELGKAVELRLYSPQTTVSLNNINLDVLKNDFHIKHVSDISLVNNAQSQRITLYPRKIGHVIIPALHLINTRTSPIKLDVTPAIDPKDNSVMKILYSIPTLTPWKKQQVLVKFELTGHAAILRLNTPNAYSDHSEIVSLDHSSKTLKQNNQSLTRHTTGWAIFPRQAGQKILELPGVQLVRDGITTHQFYPPLLNLDVKPLPVYIPATMPVGKLELTHMKMPARLMMTDKIYSTGIIIKASGVIPSGLPSIKSQLKSTSAISFYPSTIQKDELNNNTGVSTRHSYTINYKSYQQGVLNLGSVILNYFDPLSGTIKTAQFETGKFFSIHTSIAIIIGFFLIFISYLVLVKVISLVKLKWHCFLGYKNVLDALPDMKNAADIKDALAMISLAENWRSNLTLQQWHKQWSQKTHTPCPVDIKQLELMLYADKKDGIEQLAQDVQAICFHRWYLLRVFKR